MLEENALKLVRSDSLHSAILERKASCDTALVDGDTRLTYCELNERVYSVALWLRSIVLDNTAVAVFLDNSIEAIVAILAGMHAGYTVVPINTKNDSNTVHFIAEQANVGAIISSKRHADRLNELSWSIPIELLEKNNWPSLPRDAQPEFLAEPEAALVFFTSGSTGKPKGVAVSHSNLIFGADSVAQYLRISQHLRMGAVLPVSFDAGLNWILTGLARGAEVYLLRYVFPRSLASQLGKNRIQILLAVPTVFFALSEVEASDGTKGIRMASTGGRMDAKAVGQLRAAYDDLEFTVMYGLTEAFRATHLPDALWAENPQSIGRAIPHAEVHIVDDQGCEAATGQTGEIVQSGPLVSLGYVNAPAQQKLRFGPTPSFSRFAETHPISVYSGDQGFRDAQGFLYFVGRKDRLIKSRGFRISPEELEKEIVLRTRLEKVVAYGEEDTRSGQRIIIVAEGIAEKEFQINAIRQSLRGSVAEYMLPDELRWLESFPTNSNGKLDINKIVEMTSA